MRIGIAGLGLIGGSFALALRGRHEISGYDLSAETRAAATAAGIRTVGSLDELLPADAVIVATPIAAVLPTLAALAPRAADAVLLDVASVRGPVDAFARDEATAGRFVGLHPMAGRTAHGFGAADAALFRGRPMLIVPTVRADAQAMAVAGEIARDAGGDTVVCSVGEHDRMVAQASALPLALAVALRLATPDAGAIAGPGHRDATRLADTDPALALGMLLGNSANVVAAIARLRTSLDDVERAVAERDAGALRGLIAAAQARRDSSIS